MYYIYLPFTINHAYLYELFNKLQDDTKFDLLVIILLGNGYIMLLIVFYVLYIRQKISTIPNH
jgi:hypothetical protein